MKRFASALLTSAALLLCMGGFSVSASPATQPSTAPSTQPSVAVTTRPATQPTSRPSLNDLIAEIPDAGLAARIKASVAAAGVKPAAMTQPAPVFVLDAGTDLAKYPFVDGGYYDGSMGVIVTGTWKPKFNNVGIAGSGLSPLNATLTPGSGTVIDATGSSGFELTGFGITAPNAQFINCGTGNNVHDNTILTQVSKFAAVMHPAANGTQIIGNTFLFPCPSQVVYIGGADDVTISGNASPGSLGEAVFRVSPGEDGHVSERIAITKNAIGFASGKLQKPSIDIRQGHTILIDSNHATGWVRAGEATTQPTVTDLTITNNTFEPDPNNIDQVSLMAAVAKVSHNIFRLNSTQRAISDDPASTLVEADGNQKVSVDGKPMKLLINANGKQSDGTNTK